MHDVKTTSGSKQSPQPDREIDLIFRDHLAIDRTILANERTWLAYLRTALAMAALGATAIGFLQNKWMVVLGWVAVAAGVLTTIIGAWLYRNRRKKLTKIARRQPDLDL